MSEYPRDTDYVSFRANPANDHITDAMWCGQCGLHTDDLASWKAQNPEAMEQLLNLRRSRYADEMIKIDAALLGKAKAGDTKSIQLAWARFENWSPKIEEEANKRTGGRNKSFADLVAEEGA